MAQWAAVSARANPTTLYHSYPNSRTTSPTTAPCSRAWAVSQKYHGAAPGSAGAVHRDFDAIIRSDWPAKSARAWPASRKNSMGGAWELRGRRVQPHPAVLALPRTVRHAQVVQYRSNPPADDIPGPLDPELPGHPLHQVFGPGPAEPG